ncbi:alkane hydroxylase MAH1-like [Spinacia oleracea]|uniref:Alkane hydroxylase MAH1-like n=1 Tax=Spinacia oleracea TaxID=3562 RepID=A0A9R0JE00_SPIOL|nr:alkane hydroxylase MAH1-like [Spinacia oleracea]
MAYMVIITLLISFLIFCYFFRNKNGLPTNWPFVGMLPALLINTHRINDFAIEVMEKSDLIFHIKGPWFTNMNLLVTVDPTNLNHVLSKKFENYVKGAKLNEILEPFGDGIFNTDSTLWLYHRNVAQSFFNHPEFYHFMVDVTWKKVESGLILVLDHVSKNAIEIDLQDLFIRLMFDTMCIIMMDHDPLSLSVGLPSFPALQVLDASHTIVSRHIMPTCIWKFLRWLNVGDERKLKQALKVFDDFIYKNINKKRKEIMEGASKTKDLDQDTTRVSINPFITSFIEENENIKAPISHDNNNNNNNNNDKFLRDTISNFFLAGGSTTSTALSWFFYLISKNPHIINKIRQELDEILIPMKNNDDRFIKNFTEISNKLVYLHAALCEALRLYPPVAYNNKIPIEPDILPSGHGVNPNTQIIFNMYAMGRMKSIWGDDCNEFKPERWITEGGMIKYEPSYKFSVFSAGPRICMGKQMVFTQMKIVAAIIIQNYHIEVKEKNHVPEDGLILRMKHEFKVKVFPYTTHHVQ